MSHPIVQHYVPRMLLNGFVRQDHRRLHVFDKHEGRTFSAATQRLAAQTRFYDLETAEGIISLEPSLANLENRTAGIIRTLRSQRRLTGLSAEDRHVLAVFMAVQYLRTEQFRRTVADMDRQFAALLRDRGIDPEKVENYRPFRGDEEVKAFSIHMLVHSCLEIAMPLVAKDWLILVTTSERPFQIGDHPVTMHNDRDLGPYGNVGFGVPGIEIYMPISDEVALYLTCTSNGDQFRKAEAELSHLQKVAGTRGEVKQLRERLSPVIEGLKTGSGVAADPEVVKRHNALQIAHAERWVFSAVDDFELAKEMVRDHTAFRQGPRGHVG
jgi:hypothetical protein